MAETRVPVTVDGRRLSLSNLDKVLYPQDGFTKAEVLDYYSRIAPVLLPHLRGRPLTVKRYPNGVEGGFFFEKNAPAHRPSWVRTAKLPTPGSSKDREITEFAIVEDLASLVFFANLAALELHVPMWRVDDRGRALEPDTLVFDLDPGPPATIVECCRVARVLRELLAADGLTAYPKTSGSKGMQLYAPWDRGPDPSGYAKQIARHLAAEMPDQVVSVMTKKVRQGKVLIDWSQNNPAKTTVAPYSLRARATPTVSTPLTWAELEDCEHADELVFTSADVLARVEEHGDLFGPVAS
ncbi:bifunctional non-homologous end joining protein LigD [Thermocatellispora tengchongensis]|uniref:Bifunctional non-homologous end joining protein LigD n=1 Tax=Thermocatellispora tengchongensis TaxID=1073253 RepID=A0A840P9L8_9ACTN|nr:non-homologous end-joining DNA ligase [Thermocatellispora tengchongensis]MBB5133897.1 bifunctional non-homologous end joining protein LigD [Thermocatellispora tengchongensis]